MNTAEPRHTSPFRRVPVKTGRAQRGLGRCKTGRFTTCNTSNSTNTKAHLPTKLAKCTPHKPSTPTTRCRIGIRRPGSGIHRRAEEVRSPDWDGYAPREEDRDEVKVQPKVPANHLHEEHPAQRGCPRMASSSRPTPRATGLPRGGAAAWECTLTISGRCPSQPGDCHQNPKSETRQTKFAKM